MSFSCPACGSDDIAYGALLRWSKAERRWVILSIVEEACCAACGHTFPGVEETATEFH